MASDVDPMRLTPPRRYLLRMVVFLLLAGFLALILYETIWQFFLANPGLNGLIFGIMFVGIILAFRQVIRLFREVRWVNSVRGARPDVAMQTMPVLLAPVATLLGEKAGRTTISTMTLRSLLEAVGMRLDESRDTSRYLTSLLIFLGLLGTFWGLLETVTAVARVISSLQGGRDTTLLFDDLKAGLAAPLAGMGISFSSSLFGLAGSLILGFLDLQAGQAQTRFFNELEDWLTSTASDVNTMGGGPDLSAAIDRLAKSGGQGGNVTNTALANLAEGIQGLVQHMRQEQQMIRDWVEAQADQQRDLKQVLEKLARERETERR